MSTKCITDVSQYVKVEQCTERERAQRGSGKSGERERRGEREAAERRAGVTKIGLSGDSGKSAAHAPLTCSDQRALILSLRL